MGGVLSWLGWRAQNEEQPCLCDPNVMFVKYADDYYTAGLNYWTRQGADLDGMLGGFPATSEPDLKFSKMIIDDYMKKNTVGKDRCADVACGIGRVSMGLLRNYWKAIDLVEPVAAFIDKAETSLNDIGIPTKKFTCGAQDWNPEDMYDCIWAQWTLMFMTDNDVIAFLKRSAEHLTPHGIIVVKENTMISDNMSDAQWFPQDHSFARTLNHYLSLFKAAGLKLKVKRQQPDWGEDLIPLFMFVLVKK